LAFLFLVHQITFTTIPFISSKGAIPHSLSRRLVTVRAQREYHITFAPPHARGQLRLPRK
jgi:hypothetical protein